MVKHDVTVVGGGIAGLMLTKKLSDLGFSTGLIERGAKFAGGPSTKNEGWLHNGTYHANSIRDRTSAISVARRCRYGHDQIRAYAPECVEEIDNPSIALAVNSDPSEIISRWEEANVPYRQISIDQVRDRAPEVLVDRIWSAFEVEDVGINTRLLYRKLVHDAGKNGAQLYNDSSITFERDDVFITRGNGSRTPLETRLVVYTAGYGTADLFKKEFDIDMPLRYWKSHLLITPRLTSPSVFMLDPHEAAMINHGSQSISGFNEDAELVNEPDFSVSALRVHESLEKLRGLFELERDLPYLPVACVKVDAEQGISVVRSLDIKVFEPKEGHICAFPGKMTETPFLTDVLAKFVYERLDDDVIAFRPMDDRAVTQFSKTGVTYKDGKVLKEHDSFDSTNLEVQVARLFLDNSPRPVYTPNYGGAFRQDHKVFLTMEDEDIPTAMGHSDYELAERLVQDLAVFHSLFAQNTGMVGSSVLYRDAIPSNFLVDEDHHVHIDFSSSARLVHAYDDLALLLNPSWSNLDPELVKNLIAKYDSLRSEIFNTGNTPSVLSQLPMGMIGNPSPQRRKQHYLQTIDSMVDSGVDPGEALDLVEDVDFVNLNPDDYRFFEVFRMMRAEYYIQKVWGIHPLAWW